MDSVYTLLNGKKLNKSEFLSYLSDKIKKTAKKFNLKKPFSVSQPTRLQAELSGAREKYQNDILACSEQLGVEIAKAESPLRFAVTASSIVIEGWIPADEEMTNSYG
jgi:hypothetical protein